MNLNHARLPIPPFPRGAYIEYSGLGANSFIIYKKI